MVTARVCSSPGTASAIFVTVRRTSRCGATNSTSRTSGPATRSRSGAMRGPTPFSEVIGANRGKRISGRIGGV